MKNHPIKVVVYTFAYIIALIPPFAILRISQTQPKYAVIDTHTIAVGMTKYFITSLIIIGVVVLYAKLMKLPILPRVTFFIVVLSIFSFFVYTAGLIFNTEM
jgi:hypothetical protein